MADFDVKLPASEYARFVETMKLTQFPVEESEEGWLDTLDNCVITAAKIIGGLGFVAVSGYGLYVAGASVGAKEVADFCEKRVTNLLQTGIDIGVTSPSLFQRIYGIGSTFLGRVTDGLTTGTLLYVAKDYVPAIVFGTLTTATAFTVNAFTSSKNEKKGSSWQWTATKVIGTMGLLAIAGYGMYSAGINAGSAKATEICEAGIAALKNSGFQVVYNGVANLEGSASNALVPLSNSSIPVHGSALSLPFAGFNGALSDHIYKTAMENLPLPDPSVLWESAKEYATEKSNNFALAVQVVGGVIATPYILPPLVAAAKLGARFVRFIAHRR